MLSLAAIIIGILLLKQGRDGIMAIEHGAVVQSLPAGRAVPETPEAFERKALELIRAFEHRMDSLRQDSLGRKEYDSICRVRPGLLDSARAAEAYYSHKLSK